MILSKQKLDTAFRYLSYYFDKVLLVDFEKDSFEAIKVNDEEWNNLDKEIPFSKWLDMFVMSPSCFKNDTKKFNEFANYENLKSMGRSGSIKYKKLINGSYHDVLFEILPINEKESYIFIFDIDKEGIKND